MGKETLKKIFGPTFDNGVSSLNKDFKKYYDSLDLPKYEEWLENVKQIKKVNTLKKIYIGFKEEKLKDLKKSFEDLEEEFKWWRIVVKGNGGSSGRAQDPSRIVREIRSWFLANFK